MAAVAGEQLAPEPPDAGLTHQDHPLAASATGGAGLDGGTRPGDRVGLDPPQAPRLLGQPGRPAQPPRGSRAGLARRAARPCTCLAGGLTGLLWGGAARIFLLHHVTFSISSLCHCFGRRPFATGDECRNLAWLAALAFGEAWRNNHHAFPTSARHGLGRRQVDPSAWLITGLARCHLAWDVIRISPTRQEAKRGSAAA
jgi:hypothetical protein